MAQSPRYTQEQEGFAQISSRYTLRPYQQAAIDETIAWMREHDGNPIMWLPTASGKSILVAELCRLSVQHGRRVLMIVPSKELAEQNHEKIAALAGSDRVGVLSASMGRKDDPLGFNLLVATIGTVARMEPGNLGYIGLVIIDECHLVNPKSAGMYRKLIDGLMRFNRRLRVIGLTATPYRGNGIWLHTGDERLFHGIATQIKMQTLLDAGYLSPLVSARVPAKMKADGVRIDSKTGDFAVNELAAAIDKQHLVQAACRELVELGRDRQKWMLFCVTIQHAEHVRDVLRFLGVNAVLVTGNTPKRQREQSIALFRSGSYRAIVNVAALTTGFDVPEIDLIALLRNTRSPVLYTQIAGRGMRIANGKRNCLWCDFTDSTAVLGPVDLIVGRNPSKNKRTAMTALLRRCSECGEPINRAFSECPICGQLVPEEEREMVNHAETVIEAEVLSSGESGSKFNSYSVDRVSYHEHHKRGDSQAKPSMRVDYHCGLHTFSEWVCIEHSGRAKAKAIGWWRFHIPDDEAIPNNVAAAIKTASARALKPTKISVDEIGKYPLIVVKSYE